jgi:hypothetical protein
VFFVRVADKGLMLDAASNIKPRGEFFGKRLKVESLKLKKERSEEVVPPPVFCKRVRK